MLSVLTPASPVQPTRSAPLVRLLAYTQSLGLEPYLDRPLSILGESMSAVASHPEREYDHSPAICSFRDVEPRPVFGHESALDLGGNRCVTFTGRQRNGRSSYWHQPPVHHPSLDDPKHLNRQVNKLSPDDRAGSRFGMYPASRRTCTSLIFAQLSGGL